MSRWLNWAIREFSLEGVVLQHFRMRGRDMCAMGKENFLARTPPFMGDILWEHLEILQKGTLHHTSSVIDAAAHDGVSHHHHRDVVMALRSRSIVK